MTPFTSFSRYALALLLLSGIPLTLAGERTKKETPVESTPEKSSETPSNLPTSVRSSLKLSPEEAALALKAALSGALSTEEQAWIQLYYAEALRRQGDPQARAAFEQLAVDYPNHKARTAAVVAMALIDTGGGVPGGNARATLDLMSEDGIPDSLNADRFLALARAAKAENNAELLEKYSEKAKKYAAAVGKSSGQDMTAALGALTEGTEPPDLSTDLAAISLIRNALNAGDFPTVLAQAARFPTEFPTSPFAKEASYARQRAEAGTKPIRNKIAVLLPASGEFAPAARTVRAAIELAQKQEPGLDVVFLDSAGTGAGCVTQLNEAVTKQGASLILGPLLKDEAAGCAPVAQDMHVPMLALTSWEDVISAGDQVFRAYPSTQQLVDALLRETLTVRGLKKYAIVHPKNSYGENARIAMEKALATSGGKVSAVISYETSTADFRRTAQALKAKDPTLGYDAIFIPDSYQRVALLASALAYESFPIGNMRRSSHTPITLLGLNGWDNPELVRRGGSYVQDAIFVDAFDPASSDPVVQSFISNYQNKTQAMPTLVEAVAYDTLRLVGQAIATPESDLTVALRAITLTEAVAGTIRMGEDRQIQRSWRILTVDSTGIVPLPVWNPATPSE